MKFLLDVNASGSLRGWLVELGHDVAQVGAKDPRMSDEDILRWAVKEKRIIITTDNDFIVVALSKKFRLRKTIP